MKHTLLEKTHPTRNTTHTLQTLLETLPVRNIQNKGQALLILEPECTRFAGAIYGLYGAYTYYYWRIVRDSVNCLNLVGFFIFQDFLPNIYLLSTTIHQRTILLNVFQAYFGTEKDINHYAHAYGYIGENLWFKSLK